MPPELAEPTLGRACQRGGEQHTPELEVYVDGPHDRVESVEMASRIGSSIIRLFMREFESRREWCIRNMRSKRFQLLI